MRNRMEYLFLQNNKIINYIQTLLLLLELFPRLEKSRNELNFQARKIDNKMRTAIEIIGTEILIKELEEIKILTGIKFLLIENEQKIIALLKLNNFRREIQTSQQYTPFLSNLGLTFRTEFSICESPLIYKRKNTNLKTLMNISTEPKYFKQHIRLVIVQPDMKSFNPIRHHAQ